MTAQDRKSNSACEHANTPTTECRVFGALADGRSIVPAPLALGVRRALGMAENRTHPVTAISHDAPTSETMQSVASSSRSASIRGRSAAAA